MVKCTKCETVLTDQDLIFWKCPACGKVFRVNLAKLKGLQQQKMLQPEKTLLSCPDCGAGMDNGNEKLAYRCASCGNVMGGNLGYFTVGYSVEAVKAQNQEQKVFCSNCGKELSWNYEFCPNCGKNRTEETGYCSNCGAKMLQNAKFCPECGSKAAVDVGRKLQEAGRNVKRFPVRKAVIALASAALLIILTCVGITVVPKLLVTPEELMAEGKYEKAYHKAREEEKKQVLIENLLADICKNVKRSLKDPSSFQLREAWYEDEDEKRIVLHVSGKNSIGGIVDNMWLYVYDNDTRGYELFTSVSDLDEEEYRLYDDVKDTAEKFVNNMARQYIKEVCFGSNEVDEEVVDRINELDGEGLLKEVELMEEVESIYPSEFDSGDVGDTVV